MGKARLDRNDLQLPGGKRMQVEGVGRGGQMETVSVVLFSTRIRRYFTRNMSFEASYPATTWRQLVRCKSLH